MEGAIEGEWLLSLNASPAIVAVYHYCQWSKREKKE